jgi:peptide/nickel transport system substrate-binding protein
MHSALARPRSGGRFWMVPALALLAAGAMPLPGYAQEADQVVLAISQEPPNWDYTVGTATAINGVIALNVLEPLLELGADGSLKPLLAASYDVTPDALQYTFHLVDADFQDGSDFTADDVLYTFEVYKASTRPELSTVFEAVSKIDKLDDHTVQVTLSRPSQRFLMGMASLAGLMLPEDGLAGLAQHPVGTGPYSFADWRPGVETRLERFEGYHGTKPFFKEATFKLIPDENAEVNALLAGDVDVITLLVGDGKERADAISKTDGFEVLTTPSGQMNYLALNAKDPKFADIRVRQAIAYALKRDDIALGAYSGFAVPNCVFVNPANNPWNSDYCPYAYDPAKSRQLLADAGVPDFDFELKYYNLSDGPPLNEIITAQMADAGITVNGAPRELATYLDEVLGTTPNFEATVITGPQQIDSFVCPGWFASACVPGFDKLWAEADAAASIDQAVELRRQAVDLFADEAYIIPTVNWVDVSFASKKLAGWKTFRSISENDVRGLHWAE